MINEDPNVFARRHRFQVLALVIYIPDEIRALSFLPESELNFRTNLACGFKHKFG